MKDDGLYLGHIREAAERIVLFSRDGEDHFRSDLRTQDAINHVPPLLASLRKSFGD